MDKQRRRIIQAGLVGGAAIAAGCAPGEVTEKECPAEPSAPQKPLKILILGGTGYIGPHMVREALRRGHQVTLFNRGRRAKDLFPDLETRIGDRDGQLDSLNGGQWDAVIDNSGYVPRHVRDSASLLKSAAPYYLFISSVSAYARFDVELDEDSPLATIEDETVEEITGETYGALKVLCEKAVAEVYGAENCSVLRPTYICGPGDTTDRFSYWPVRVSRGGEMLLPESPDSPIQIIDVRDLASFVVRCVERRTSGIYNTVTPRGEYTLGKVIDDSQAVSGTQISPVWMDLDFIAENQLVEKGEIPTWAPSTGPESKWALASGERAAAAGMETRPIRETIRGILDWWQTLPEERRSNMRAGMNPEREAELIAAWKAREEGL